MLRYDTCYARDHTVLPATKHEPHLPLLPSHRASPPLDWYSLRLPTDDGQAELVGGRLDQDKFQAPGIELRYGHPSEY